MDHREMARAIGLARTLLGGFAAFFPRTACKLFLGSFEPEADAVLLMRGFGVRDAALGAGVLVALDGDGNAARWAEARPVTYAGDAIAAVLAPGLPASRRFLWIVSAGASAYLGGKAAAGITPVVVKVPGLR
ncbi:MAG: hypothetical protein ABR575_01925 [Actinomycetota bacterium]